MMELIATAVDATPVALPDGLEGLFSARGLVALATITLLEVVLGIDNVVFIAILTGRLPEHQQDKARTLGLVMAAVMRIGLLFVAAWIVSLEKVELFEVSGVTVTPKTLILLGGGFFLVAKATWEMHHQVMGHVQEDLNAAKAGTAVFGVVIAQVLMLDLVFSIDSVITAVGMTTNMLVMICAVLIAVAVMLFAAGPVGRFVQKYPSMKILALTFLVLIGVLLIAEAFHLEQFERGYVYSAMGFAFFVELLNMRIDTNRAKARAVAEGMPKI